VRALRGRRRTLARLVIATFVAGFVAALLASIFLSTAARSTLREDAVQQNAALASHLAARFDLRVTDQIDLLGMLAGTSAFVDPGPQTSAELRVLLRASPRYDELFIVAPHGEVVAAAATRFFADPADQPRREDVIDGLRDGSFVALRHETPSVLEIGAVLADPNGELEGVLVAAVPLDVIQSHLLEMDVGAGTRRGFVDGEGRILVHPERDLVVAGEVIEFEPGPGLRAVVERGDRTFLVSGAATRHLGGAVIVEQSEADALRPVADRIRQLNALVVAVIAATVLSVMVVGGYVLRPLRPLTDAVARIGRGERNVRVEAPGDDEIGDLARQFNAMSEELDRREHQLAELEHLALVINSRADREMLCRDVVDGARSLFEADAAALHLAGEGDEAAVVISGELSQEALDPPAPPTEGLVVVDMVDGLHRISATVPGPEGSSLGTLLAVRDRLPGEGELDLVVSFVAFVGVALENVGRLELERRLVGELQETMEHRRDLVSNVTHELRTPLVCIQGFSESLLEQWHQFDDDDRRELLAKVLNHTQELDDLVGRMLDFSTIERGAFAIHRTRLQLRDVIAEAVSSLLPVLGSRPAHVDVPDVEVFADEKLLVRTLTNLLSNAAKYSEPGSPVWVSAHVRDDDVLVEVTDEGMGMSAAEVAQAFQPFWRAGRPGARGVRGAGIGLSLVAEYVRLMDGSHGARSRLGRGSTFYFTVPRADPVSGDPARPIDASQGDRR
jgi:signal transduction histidine kinase